MKRFTAEQISSIEAINGTLETRYEYFDAIAEIAGGCNGGARWNVNTMKVVMLDSETAVDITTKKIKGRRFVTRIDVLSKDRKKNVYLKRDNKKGVWYATYDYNWFENGEWKREPIEKEIYVG